MNAKIRAAKAKLGRFFANGQTQRRALLHAASGLPESSFSNYWAELRDAQWIQPDKVIPSVWSATEKWSKELSLDFPEDEG